MLGSRERECEFPCVGHAQRSCEPLRSMLWINWLKLCTAIVALPTTQDAVDASMLTRLWIRFLNHAYSPPTRVIGSSSVKTGNHKSKPKGILQCGHTITDSRTKNHLLPRITKL